MTIEGLGLKRGTGTLKHFRIDADHSNAYTVWQRMGSPQNPSTAEYQRLERASDLAMLAGPSRIDVVDGRASLAFTLPRQAVSLVLVEW